MRVDQLKPCPFCGAKPVINDDIGPTGFTWSNEEEQIFQVACMTKNCPPSWVYIPDVVWNEYTSTQGVLMKYVFQLLEDESSPLFEEKKKRYRLYVMSH
ncbi:Lar family restriction alleviation protein [Kosakonia cowanii]|uniref:Lar family restriction alleviation protein n=1 Tax=Kosakonia cowanii TaxID=208223 RepID=UPI003D65CCD9